MSAPVFHRFDRYGPACGVRDGVNAADMDPPEITCKRCWRARGADPIDYWEGGFGFSYFRREPLAERRNGKLYAVRLCEA